MKPTFIAVSPEFPAGSMQAGTEERKQGFTRRTPRGHGGREKETMALRAKRYPYSAFFSVKRRGSP
jgi:hypothetical protein